MKCPSCGTQLNCGAKFCHKCGKKVEKIVLNKKEILIISTMILIVVVALFLGNALMNISYATTKYLSGIVEYINAAAYQEAIDYYRNNPCIEKDDRTQMDEDECQLLALYYYADYLNYVTNISEEELAGQEQRMHENYESKYKNLLEMKDYLCINAVRNVETIHAEVISCQDAASKVDECYTLVFEGVSLAQDIKDAFLEKRKSMEERCERFTVQELKELRETEHVKWQEHTEECDKNFEELKQRTDMEFSLLGEYIDEDFQFVNLPYSDTIYRFYRDGDCFFEDAGEWISNLEKTINKQFDEYNKENDYWYENKEQVNEPLPNSVYQYLWLDDIEELVHFEEQYKTEYKEQIDIVKKDAIILWAQNSKEKLQTDMLINLEKISTLENDTKVYMAEVTTDSNNILIDGKDEDIQLRENDKENIDERNERFEQKEIIVKPGDKVQGIIEKRWLESDENVGGADIEYHVIRFDTPMSFELFSAENGQSYIVENIEEMPIYVPEMGNMGMIDLTPYEGMRVMCILYPGETYTRLGITAEAGDFNVVE